MTAVSNRSKAATRRSAWERFGESLEIGNHITDKASVLPMPAQDIYFELLLDASILANLHRRNFDAVMANDRSSDLAIVAAFEANNEADLALSQAWRKFKDFAHDFAVITATQQAA